jgi:hypothetical protein
LDVIFSVYLNIKRVSSKDADSLIKQSDLFKPAQKCGTTQREDISVRFVEQTEFPANEFKQILVESKSSKNAQKEGFTSSGEFKLFIFLKNFVPEVWAYGLELAFERL